MAKKKIASRITSHDFKDTDGNIITYAVLEAATGLTRSAIRNRLKCYEEPPDNLQSFLKDALEFRTQSQFAAAVAGAEFIEEIKKEDPQTTKAVLDELEIKLKKEKLREIEFKNERAEGKYVLLFDVQLALDNFLISLKTNLEAIPEQVIQSIMTCREESEGEEILFEALQHLTRDFASNPIKIGEDDDDG